ncbi:MAG TPA: ABC transporter substrate-binding protein [Paracoccus sp. (in: a-proteobacteria)]|nr:ABC transporter substrate-binding protein [Paracoccus sp. (in: a-proteobacteria)]
MPIDTRRGFLGLLAACSAAAILPAAPARALTQGQATALVQQAVDEVYAVINSGRPAARMYRDFEGIFVRHADVDAIARTVLGPAARQVSAAQFAAYAQALQGFVARKYGKRFREFIGGRIEVRGARQLKSFWAVDSTAYLSGQSPMAVEWHVSDRSGRPRFFNLIIEGVNMLATEREEIRAMLARNRGDIAALTAALQQAG